MSYEKKQMNGLMKLQHKLLHLKESAQIDLMAEVVRDNISWIKSSTYDSSKMQPRIEKELSWLDEQVELVEKGELRYVPGERFEQHIQDLKEKIAELGEQMDKLERKYKQSFYEDDGYVTHEYDDVDEKICKHFGLC